MKQILMATDFSQTAQHAGNYALNLAAYLGVGVELLHAYMLPFAYADTPMPLMNLEEVQAISERSMEAEMNRLRAAFPGIPLSSRSVPGDLSEVLEERIEQLKPDLVVLGSSGEGGATLFGSMAMKIMRHCPLAVLVVPERASWRPVRRICLASDYKADHPLTPLVALRHWVQLMKADLDIFHVSDPEAPMLQIPFALKHQFAELVPRFFSETSQDLEAAIHDFVASNQVDWLVVIPRKYGFWERLFHRSATKQLALGSDVPVLALHEEAP